MSELPAMPKDWWPEIVTVRGTQGNIDLCFLLSGHDLSLANHTILKDKIDGLRLAMWQATFATNYVEPEIITIRGAHRT